MNEELKIIISATVDEVLKATKKGKDAVKDFTKKSKETFKEYNDAVQKVGDKSKKFLGIATTAIAGTATALLALTASTEEFRTGQAKLTTAFETAGASAETAKDTYNDLYRVLGDDGQAVEAANHLSQLTTNQKELEQWTTICQGVYATFGDSLPIESLTEAANETAKTGALTGSLADALNWAGISEDDFQAKLEACNTEAEREQLIRETLNGLYEESATTYEETAGDILAQNEAQAKLNETTATLGEALAPVNTMLTELATEVLAELIPIITDFMDEHGEELATMLTDIGEAIGMIFTWLVDNWELVSTIGAIILGIATALTIFSTVMGIVNAVMMASPVTWIVLGIVAAIAALVAIIILVIQYWDEIAAAGSAAWEKIKEIWDIVATWFMDNVVTPVVNFFTDLWNGIVNIFQSVSSWFSEKFTDAVNGIKNAFKVVGSFFSGIWKSITNVFKSVNTWFKDKFNAAVTGIKNVFGSIGSFFTGVWEDIKEIFSNVGTAIADAVSGAFSSAVNWVLEKAIGIINGFISAINFAIGVINAIPGVNISKLSKLSVPQMAEGGIVDSATLAVIGERGKEAVVPLENNTEWLDMLVERLGAGSGANTPIVLTVDGKVFAETSVKSINNLTRQRGSLPLVLA